ncbi:hypothetical protein KQX54_016210 [Cotesia glomerata]|uniref:Uncharacterized protein n=1 Tax=Cotesia glomerata TaxID=32391 RepID=A0AAV7J0W5_COTGL|nr:hypothetical protein KQX54_016210 [Cotesia glomerata]
MWVFNLLSRGWAYIDNEYKLPGPEHNTYICNILNEHAIKQPLQGEVPNYAFPCNIIRDGGYYYLVGDIDDKNNRVGNVYRINMKSGIWECVYKCQRKDKENKLWKNKLAAFDVENPRWRMINTHGDVDHVPNYPMNRDEFSGSSLRITHYRDSNSDVIVILSGEIDSKDYYNDLWTLNLSTMTWKNIDNRGSLIPRTFRRYSMTVSPAGQLFTFGEFIGDPKARVPCGSRVHSVWITIPKLIDICWESVLHYLPGLVSMSQEQIENLGISWKFFQSRIN